MIAQSFFSKDLGRRIALDGGRVSHILTCLGMPWVIFSEMQVVIQLEIFAFLTSFQMRQVQLTHGAHLEHKDLKYGFVVYFNPLHDGKGTKSMK